MGDNHLKKELPQDLPIQSQALAANIAQCPTHDSIDPKYMVLLEVISGYAGLMEASHAFLCELTHPLKNWGFILEGARNYGLKHMSLLRKSPEGPGAASLLIDILRDAAVEARDENLRHEAVDNLIVFVQKLAGEIQGPQDGFSAVVGHGIDLLSQLPQEPFLHAVFSYYSLTKAVKTYWEKASPDSAAETCARLLTRYFVEVYDYWRSRRDPRDWFEKETGARIHDDEVARLFELISVAEAERLRAGLDGLSAEPARERLEKLLDLPAFGAWVSAYRSIANKLASLQEANAGKIYRKLLFLFHVMDIPGLSRIHEETLREINRLAAWLIAHSEPSSLKNALDKTFAILEASARQYPESALDCVLRIGQEVYGTDDENLLEFFFDRIISLGFQFPRISGVTEEWQALVNVAHLKNVRVWMKLIEIAPSRSKKLLSALIVNLALGGIFVRDTDLFPHDVTDLLNAPLKGAYNLAKQLVRQFPVYFNEIGAEGELRDLSTDMDELLRRDDELVHFLRKQAHVESSFLTLRLAEATLAFWLTLDKEALRGLIPASLFDWTRSLGRFVDDVHQAMKTLFENNGYAQVPDLLRLQPDEIDRQVEAVEDVPPEQRKRLALAIKLYRLLDQKYNMGFEDYEAQLKPYETMGFHNIPTLLKGLGNSNPAERLKSALSYLRELKSVILSGQEFPITEDIYRKRHIAVDIPSMYGRYHEKKFDSLGLTLRLEKLANTLFEELVEGFDLDLITKAAMDRLLGLLRLFREALEIDGIVSPEFDRGMDFLRHASGDSEFTLSQYVDVIDALAEAVKKMVSLYFHDAHDENLRRILSSIRKEDLRPKYAKNTEAASREELTQRVGEQFLRDLIANGLAVQTLDRFINRVRDRLYAVADELPSSLRDALLSYSPDKVICPLHRPRQKVNDPIFLGNKGFNLVRMAAEGIPVPSGFIITTEVFRRRDLMAGYKPVHEDFRQMAASAVKSLEQQTGRVFGGGKQPLLLSVRSGAAISQPGMMETILNVGINEQVVSSLARDRQSETFAWDCLRRYLLGWGLLNSMTRSDFSTVERAAGKSINPGADAAQRMRKRALAYRDALSGRSVPLFDDPWEQLFAAIPLVQDSWNAPRAKAYRRLLGISDNWGTAVVVQAMAFGNLGEESGAGVIFTHSPMFPSDKIRVWGDFIRGGQGEDVVSGTTRTLPVSRKQAEIENRLGSPSLQELFPEAHRALLKVVRTLVIDNGWGPQDIEFTFERDAAEGLYILQTRDMAMRRRDTVTVFDPAAKEREGTFLCRGLGVSGGAISGRAVFSGEEIDRWRKKEPDTPLILIRPDTAPDDIREISAADGLLTARGGSTSHASIVAHRLGKTCVVGCAYLDCYENRSECSIAEQKIREGVEISIDGRSGEIYLGRIPILTAPAS